MTVSSSVDRLSDFISDLRKSSADGMIEYRGQVGVEVEGHYLSRCSRRHVSHVADRALPHDPYICAEQGKNQFEINFPPVPLGPEFPTSFRKHLAQKIELLRDNAAPFGAEPLMCSIPLTLGRKDLHQKNAYPSPRSGQLNTQFQRVKQEFLSRKGYIPLVDGVFPHSEQTFGAISSIQLHHELSSDPKRAAHEINIAHLITPLVLALSAGSPYFISGKSTYSEYRVPIWDVADMGRGRVFYGPKWVKTPFELLERYAQVPFVDMGANYEALDNQLLFAQHTKSVWTHLRLCVGADHWRLENRVFPSVSPDQAELTALLYYGLLRGLAADKGLDKFADGYSFENSATNFYRAAKRGTAAKLNWLDGNDYSPADLMTVLFPSLQRGLDSSGIDCSSELTERFQERIRNGSPADFLRREMTARRRTGMKRRHAGAEVTELLLARQKRFLA